MKLFLTLALLAVCPHAVSTLAPPPVNFERMDFEYDGIVYEMTARQVNGETRVEIQEKNPDVPLEVPKIMGGWLGCFTGLAGTVWVWVLILAPFKWGLSGFLMVLVFGLVWFYFACKRLKEER